MHNIPSIVAFFNIPTENRLNMHGLSAEFADKRLSVH